DAILTVRASEEVDVVDGQSAGAAITIAILAALMNQTVKQGVYMTGTINSDGSIGAVGGIAAKALAAAEKGSERFLVPEGQSKIIVYKPTTYEIFPGWSRTVYQQETMELEDYLQKQGYSIIVEEVETIEDASAFFFDQPLRLTPS
ncbi:S16 family serine protease, partial [[Eubacterium] cellulosolvens]